MVEKPSSTRWPRLWREARSWALSAAVLAVLYYSGGLALISQGAGALLIRSGLMNASTDAPPVIRDFDYNFVLNDLNGRALDVSTLRGKTLFINVWATWCGPCRIEMPSIQSLYEKADTSQVQFLMISIDNNHDLAKVRAYVSQQSYSFPVFMPAEGLPELLRVPSIPSTFIVDRDGKVVVRKSGLANYDTRAIRKLLGARETRP